MKIMVSNICDAFKQKAVGSKVKKGYHKQFMNELSKAIRKHDWNYSDRVKGQTVLNLPHVVASWVSPGTYFSPSGCARLEDFVVRVYRNRVGTYLKRKSKMVSDNVSAVVYTAVGYRNDPDFCEHDVEGVRFHKFFGKSDGYVLVAVLANPSWSKSTVSYSRFVKNLAGANNEYKVMTKDELVDLAKKVVEHNDNFMGVAD